jgi:hypothetical protein
MYLAIPKDLPTLHSELSQNPYLQSENLTNISIAVDMGDGIVPAQRTIALHELFSNCKLLKHSEGIWSLHTRALESNSLTSQDIAFRSWEPGHVL